MLRCRVGYAKGARGPSPSEEGRHSTRDLAFTDLFANRGDPVSGTLKPTLLQCFVSGRHMELALQTHLYQRHD